MSQQGQVIFNGRYELHRRLGRGGMAEVYLARDQMLDRPVAVKVLFPALATDAGFVERFRREAQSAANLQHPNIVSVFDWGEANGTYFIVMEYVEGRSLAEVLHDEGRLHPDRAAEVMSDMAAALGFAHRNGVVHRDVKPGNVLIDTDGQVKVADFGIARALSDTSDQNLTKTGSVMGTATYFSPEQARGTSVDPRSDIYSLGCVLYELTTGHPPFTGDSTVAIAYKHVQEMPVPPRQIDPALPETLEAITLKCLAKNPANRYPSALDLRADLRRYLDGARIMAEPVLAQGTTGLMAPTAYGDQTAVAGQAPWGDDTYGDYDEDYYDEEEEPKRSKWFLAVLILLLFILAGLLFLLARNFADSGTQVAQVTVPGVVGMQLEEAQAALEAQGLVASPAYETTDDIPENEVFEQDPAPGDSVDEGSEVTLRVSSGLNPVTVPDLSGMTREEAMTALEEVGLLANFSDVESDEVEAGRVVSQDPTPNEEVPPDTPVNVQISSGAGQTTVPDVSNSSEGDARAAIEGAGLAVGGVEREAHPSIADGNVVRTDPAANTTVDRGARVTIFLSSGPGTVGVPNVVGLTEDNARRQLEGFEVVVTEQRTNDAGQDRIVASQNPSPGQQVPPGSRVSLVVYNYVEPEVTVPAPPGGGGNNNGDD
jgi:eukaryotic-like serine/threonine-protein kinase